jgi:succinyl-CoA synthetase alpha subunit
VIKIYIRKNSRVIVQGITGGQGSFHTRLMLDYGTNIVAGITPGKGGQEIFNIPIYDSVKEAVLEHNADTSIVFVPARFAYSAVKESLDSNITQTCVITENIPIFDTLRLVEYAKSRDLHIIGPNTPGMLIPDNIKLGIMPNDLAHFGDIAIISKSGTLSYEITHAIGAEGMGVAALVGIGGDSIRGTTLIEAVKYYNEDHNTKSIVIIGEIGSDEEEKAAVYIKNYADKPIIAHIAGRHAPKGKRMGHAGAIISGDFGTAVSKINALKDAGVHIANLPWDIPKILKEIT